MNDDFENLKRDYRAIEAPPHLATRISARVVDSPVHSKFWMPLAVACTAILALVSVLPFTTQLSTRSVANPVKPSLSALAALKPVKPSAGTPSMTQLRSVNVPKIPARPRPAKSSKSPTTNQFETTPLKEKNDVYV